MFRQINFNLISCYSKPVFVHINRTLSNYNYRKTNNSSKIINIDNEKIQTNIKYINSDTRTNKQLIDSNYGLRKFITRTFVWTGGGITGSIGVSMIGATFFPEFASTFAPVLDGFIMSIFGVLGIGFSDYKVHKDVLITKNTNNLYRKSEQIEIFYTKNSIQRLLGYSSFLVGNGLMMMPLFIIYPHAVLPAFVASGSVFSGSVLYAWSKKEGELEIWKSGLYSGLTGMVGVSLLGIGTQLFMGHNMFSDFTHLISLYGGIPLFSGLVAYDTHKSIDRYMKGDPDHLGCSSELHLDFLNLFVRFAEIIGKMNSDK